MVRPVAAVKRDNRRMNRLFERIGQACKQLGPLSVASRLPGYLYHRFGFTLIALAGPVGIEGGERPAILLVQLAEALHEGVQRLFGSDIGSVGHGLGVYLLQIGLHSVRSDAWLQVVTCCRPQGCCRWPQKIKNSRIND